MENMNEVEFSEVTEDHATEYRDFKVHCQNCSAETDACDYPSSAAIEATQMGMKIVWLGEDAITFCKECIEAEVYKEWI